MRKLSELGISPAPWKIDDPGDGLQVCAPDGCTVCFMGGVIETPANARLIAAAPKLYEALRKITEEQECGKDCKACKNDLCVIQECKAALAEAAGEEVSDDD